ncbi:MAG: VOC family protein [Candidatus Bathyarchaeota archaeon]|jgi:predicted enzyme related to lactoylglutathione lyase
MPRIVHFEVEAERPEQIIKFYEQVFGWKVEKWEGPIEYWLITTGTEDEPGIDGGLSRRSDGEPSTVNTIDVPSIDEYIKKVKNNGGSIVRPKMAVPGVGWMAYFKDPDGNMFGIMERDKSAK